MLRDAGEAYAAAGVKDLVRSDVERLSLPPGGGRARPLAELQGAKFGLKDLQPPCGSLLNDASTVAQLPDDAARLGMLSYLAVGMN